MVFEKGGESLDVIIVVINVFENLLYFNVGCGVVYIYDGVYEFDVLIMDGCIC